MAATWPQSERAQQLKPRLGTSKGTLLTIEQGRLSRTYDKTVETQGHRALRGAAAAVISPTTMRRVWPRRTCASWSRPVVRAAWTPRRSSPGRPALDVDLHPGGRLASSISLVFEDQLALPETTLPKIGAAIAAGLQVEIALPPLPEEALRNIKRFYEVGRWLRF